MVLGLAFEKMNVSFLVGWAFNVAASANLPSLVMLLFWICVVSLYEFRFGATPWQSSRSTRGWAR